MNTLGTRLAKVLDVDADHIMAHTKGLWEEFRGKRLFITGGTGFFGCWLLESFVRANEEFGLNAEVVVLTRAPEAFMGRVPRLARHPAIVYHKGDVRDFAFPDGRFSHVIHAATETSAILNAENPLLVLDTMIEGTRRVLDFTIHSGAKKFLLTSSGAVYGRQPPALTHIPETYQGAPDPLDSGAAYGEGKRVAELLCAIYAKQYGVEAKIARCFAFVGAGLPLDAHFAIGNFIRDAKNGGPVKVKGDGTPVRSYLYAADLAIWLWTILVRGRSCTPYNVGASDGYSISALAGIVAKLLGDVGHVIDCPALEGVLPDRYVPDVARAAVELGLRPVISLEEAVLRTGRG